MVRLVEMATWVLQKKNPKKATTVSFYLVKETPWYLTQNHFVSFKMM